MNGTVLLINGPNLNLLGQREPEIYGSTTLADIEINLQKKFSASELKLLAFQSNTEGELVNFIQEHQSADYAIINAGAFTHTSVAIRDAIKGVGLKFVEVHISNVHAREEFRQKSYLSDIASGIIVGCGVQGYELAADYIMKEVGA